MSAIPAELVERRQWVVWKPVERDGKITKPPFTATAPDRHASTTDSSTWCTYAEAVAAVEAGLAEGVGFVFTGDDDFVGIDFDKCRDPETGEVDRSVADLISVVDSYTEVSPSGTGVHVIAIGLLPGPGRKRAGIEIYGCGRYFTMTGIPLNGLPPGNIAKRQAAVEKIWGYLAPPRRGEGTVAVCRARGHRGPRPSRPCTAGPERRQLRAALRRGRVAGGLRITIRGRPVALRDARVLDRPRRRAH